MEGRYQQIYKLLFIFIVTCPFLEGRIYSCPGVINLYKPKLEKEIRCPLEYGLEVFGGKWKSRIICVLAAKEVLRYSELRKETGNITDAVLAAALKKLISDQIVVRRSFDEIPPRVEYSLTEKGQSVVPILQSICQWAGLCYKEDSNKTMVHCQKCDYHSNYTT